MNLLAIYTRLWSFIRFDLFLFSGALFMLGVFVAPWVYKKNITLLTKYPLWIFKTVSQYIEHEYGILPLFILIFSLNVLSLLIDVVAGWGIILPVILAFLTGLNIAIISYKLGGHTGIIAIFFNPVALLEIPTAWLALSLGANLGVTILFNGYSSIATKVFSNSIDVFVFFIIPLLAIAAFLEATLITFIRRNSDDDNEDDLDVW
jgi:hypothetical protein